MPVYLYPPHLTLPPLPSCLLCYRYFLKEQRFCEGHSKRMMAGSTKAVTMHAAHAKNKFAGRFIPFLVQGLWDKNTGTWHKKNTRREECENLERGEGSEKIEK